MIDAICIGYILGAILLAIFTPNADWYRKNNTYPLIRDIALTIVIIFWPLSLWYGLMYQQWRKEK